MGTECKQAASEPLKALKKTGKKRRSEAVGRPCSLHQRDAWGVRVRAAEGRRESLIQGIEPRGKRFRDGNRRGA